MSNSRLAADYAAGSVTWQIKSETGVAFCELLLEVGRQGLQLPTVVSHKSPAQHALFEEALRMAAAPGPRLSRPAVHLGAVSP